MEDLMVAKGSLDSHVYGSVEISNNVGEAENFNVDFLEDLDSYWDDINDRLTISRMVSDSVVRGMVNAVEQEAAEKIAQKELEVASLRETLHLYHVGADENETLETNLIQNEVYSSFPDAFVQHEWIAESLGNLRAKTKNQFMVLVEEINRIRGLNLTKGTNLGAEMLGFGGILQENMSVNWVGVDTMLESLKNVLDAAFKQMNDMVCLSKDSLSLWQEDHDFKEEIGHRVVANFLKEEFEDKLLEQNAVFSGNEGLNSLKKIKEISSLRQELDAISKSLSVHDGQPSSPEASEEQNQKRTDHLHRKISGTHISHSSLWEGNGKHEESVTSMPENLDALKHLSRDELVHHFKTEMSNLKRDHDYKMQEMTEEYFILKREYLKLKERGSFSPVKRDKEFDALRKKIPEVILKLDKILLENEKLVRFASNDLDISTLKSRLDSFSLENRQLRDLLMDKEKEVKRLDAQVSDFDEKISLLSQAEAHLSKMIGKLESALEDSQVEASISENIYACLLRELMDQIKCVDEESELKCLAMQEVYEFIFRDLAGKGAAESSNGAEDSYIESSITLELCMVIFKEALEEAKEKVSDLNKKCIIESETRVYLEMNILQRENALRFEVEEKERLMQDILSLRAVVEEKEKLLQKSEDALAKERKSLELASQELSKLRNMTSQQEKTILENSEESRVVSRKLVEALEKIEVYEAETRQFRHNLELAREELKKTNDEKMRLLAVIQENQQKLSAVEAKEKESRKQIQSLSFLANALTKGFTNLEHRVAEIIQKSNLRLQNQCSQLRFLTEQVNVLKETESIHKQQLEKKCSDLEKAEAEVDLLGDEVDTLLDLLEKIYIALDHYSPVLKHYPGIIEILKRVRRELCGESKRLV